MKKLLTLALLAFLSCAGNALAQTGGCAPMVPCGGGGNVPSGVVQNNPNSSSDPTASNDQTQGYAVGSIWQNSTTGRIWVARNVSTAAAVWTLLELSDHPGYIVNNWYLPAGITAIASGGNGGTGTLRLVPAYIKERITISNLGVRVTTLSAGGNVQAAIYANNPATGRPTGNALVSTASMSTASVANVSAAASVQLEPGLYWFATCLDNATAVLAAVSSTQAIASTTIGSAIASGGGALTTTAGLTGVNVAGTFGTWPSLTSATFNESAGSAGYGAVVFQVASVP